MGDGSSPNDGFPTSDDALRELLTSPIEHDAPQRRGPHFWIWIGLGSVLVVAAVAVALILTVGGSAAPTTTTIAPAFSEQGDVGPRTLTPLVGDTATGRILLFGGNDLDETGRRASLTNETWQFDPITNAWWRLFRRDVPPARAGHGIAYDAASAVTIVFGGAAGSYDPCHNVFWCAASVHEDTWAFDAAAGKWERRDPVRSPPGRFGTAMVHDPGTGRIILFGGGGIDPETERPISFGDTWAYDAGNDTWIDLAPETAPAARAHHTLVYDARLERILLWGGKGPGIEQAELWAYDPAANTWTALDPTPDLGPRWLGAGAHHAGTGRTYLIGGEGPISEIDQGTSAEVWSFGSDGWRRHALLETPVWRHGLAHAAGADRLVLVALGRTLGYDPDTDTWMDLVPFTDPSTESDDSDPPPEG